MELLTTFLAILGALLNSRGLRIGFVVWIVSNSMGFIIHCSSELYWFAFRDLIFTGICIYGLIYWRKPCESMKTLLNYGKKP